MQQADAERLPLPYFFLKICFSVSFSVCVYTCACEVRVPKKTRKVRPPGTGVKSSLEPPNMGVEDKLRTSVS